MSIDDVVTALSTLGADLGSFAPRPVRMRCSGEVRYVVFSSGTVGQHHVIYAEREAPSLGADVTGPTTYTLVPMGERVLVAPGILPTGPGHRPFTPSGDLVEGIG